MEALHEDGGKEEVRVAPGGMADADRQTLFQGDSEMRRSMIIGGLALAFLVGFAGASALQDKDPWTPPPPVEDEFLDKLVGKWEWEGTIIMDGQERTFKGTESYEWGLNHQFMMMRFESPDFPGPGQKYEGMGLMRRTPDTNEYQGWWFDVFGDADRSQGTRDGDTLKMRGEGSMGKSRYTFAILPDGTVASEGEVMFPGEQEYKPFTKMKGKKME